MFEYKFWDVKNKRILRHCDVTFDENVLYKNKEKKNLKTTKQVGVEDELKEQRIFIYLFIFILTTCLRVK